MPHATMANTTIPSQHGWRLEVQNAHTIHTCDNNALSKQQDPSSHHHQEDTWIKINFYLSWCTKWHRHIIHTQTPLHKVMMNINIHGGRVSQNMHCCRISSGHDPPMLGTQGD